jgi:DNA-binding winged helix-turn-helix (wHTH) protein/tetratricopeptide (TPR) repeat protein
MTKQPNHIREFGPWRLDAAQHLLFHHGAHIPLQPKAFEILWALVERHGEVVSKEELIERVWPDTIVEEINLTKNISVLRKTLANGDGAQDYIQTIPKRGYRFVAELSAPQTEETSLAQVAPNLPPSAGAKAESAPQPSVQFVWTRRQLVVAFVVIGAVLSLALYWRLSKTDGMTANERGSAAVLRLCASGRELWNQRTVESMRKGLTCFEQAVELDPQYAPAWVGIADSLSLLAEYRGVGAHEAYPKAKAAALRALELDEGLAEAHTALALSKTYYDWDWNGADTSFRRALSLNPQHATTHQWYAEFLVARGKFPEALIQIHQAQELDPGSLIIQTAEAWIRYLADDHDGAIAQCRRVIERDSRFAEVYAYLGLAYEQKGMFREAMEAFEKRSAMMEDNTQRASSLRLAPVLNADDYWRRRLEVEEVKLNGTSYEAAEALAQLGETERALALLESACEQRAPIVPFLKVYPNYAPLHAHPRFQALLQRTRLNVGL